MPSSICHSFIFRLEFMCAVGGRYEKIKITIFYIFQFIFPRHVIWYICWCWNWICSICTEWWCAPTDSKSALKWMGCGLINIHILATICLFFLFHSPIHERCVTHTCIFLSGRVISVNYDSMESKRKMKKRKKFAHDGKVNVFSGNVDSCCNSVPEKINSHFLLYWILWESILV